MKKQLLVVALLACMSWPVAAFAQDPPGDREAGEKIYKRVCVGCHAIETDDLKVGPSLRKLVGRPAGSLKGSSAALMAAGFAWDRKSFDTYMSDPTAAVPGTTMLLQINDAQSRADLFAYLESVAKEQK